MFGLLNEFSEFGETLIYSKFTLRRSGEAVSRLISVPSGIFGFWILRNFLKCQKFCFKNVLKKRFCDFVFQEFWILQIFVSVVWMFERRIWSDGLRHRGFSRRAPGTLRCALAVSKRNTVSAYFILKDRNFLGITSRVEINRNLSVKVRALDLFPDWLFTWKSCHCSCTFSSREEGAEHQENLTSDFSGCTTGSETRTESRQLADKCWTLKRLSGEIAFSLAPLVLRHCLSAALPLVKRFISFNDYSISWKCWYVNRFLIKNNQFI